jgi:hypothetical protein
MINIKKKIDNKIEGNLKIEKNKCIKINKIFLIDTFINISS